MAISAPISRIFIPVIDFDRAIAFYQRLLDEEGGWSIAEGSISLRSRNTQGDRE